MNDDLKTLNETLYNSARIGGNKTYLKYRIDEKYFSISYKEFFYLVKSLSAFLLSIGVKKEDKIGIISENMYKWLIADFATLLLGAIDVPRGSDSTALELEYILKHSDVKYCFVENELQFEKVLSIKKKLSKLKYIILFTSSVSLKQLKRKMKIKSVKVLLFDEILESGKKLLSRYEKKVDDLQKKIKEDDIVTIIYTSGTTGIPKGVMLTHKNIMHNVKVLPDVIDITENERWMSILPVWHVFERTLEYIIMSTVAMMGYSKPTAKYLLPDFQEYKPTLMVAVPRVWESLYLGIKNKMKKESALKYLLFLFFINAGFIHAKAYKELKGLTARFKKPIFILNLLKKIFAFFTLIIMTPFDLLGEMIIFKKVRALTGGVLRGPISGGGALPQYVDNFYAAIKMDILEGWGLTETSPVNGVRTFGRKVLSTVGPLAPGVSIMIGDKNGNPLANYSEKGIVYLKGDNIMKGYYKEPEKTKAVFTKDGWFNTGDLGRMTITGELQLCGRSKDTIVLTGGENIEPEPIENKLFECELIFQVMVVGQDKKVLGALIVPSMENLEDFAHKNNIKYNSIDELCKNKFVLIEFKKEIKNKINHHHGFRSYERIPFFSLITKPFEPGIELTYSLKMKRDIIAAQYKKNIDKMFD